MPILANLTTIVKWLFKVVFREKHSNVLESYLWYVLTSVEMVAQLRASAAGSPDPDVLVAGTRRRRVAATARRAAPHGGPPGSPPEQA